MNKANRNSAPSKRKSATNKARKVKTGLRAGGGESTQMPRRGV